MRAAQRATTLTGLLLALGATASRAQHPQTREGFWINFGFGYGSAFERPCDNGCSDTSFLGGATAFVRLGGTVSRNVLIGGEVDAWTHDYSPGAETLGSVTAALYYYPNPTGGLFVKGGVGFSDYDLSVSGSSLTGVGMGFVAGLGYDARIGRNVSITPVGDFWYGSVGDLKSGGALIATGWKHAVVTFGLGVTFH
jgi:outer membrane protein with beta-barrel domain